MPALLTPNEILSLSAQAARRLLEAGDGDCALLYLALLESGGESERARRTLKWDDRRLEEAAARLARMELISQSQAPRPAALAQPEADRPPEYSRGDLAAALEREGAFKRLYAAMEECLGRPLSDADLRSLYTLYDFLALPGEVILTVAHWCAQEAQRKGGPGKRPRMPDIKKEAFRWKRLGLDTPEAAEDYLRRRQAQSARERELLKLLDIRDRDAVGREREYLSAWTEMGFADDAVRLAYERTLFQKQSMNWPYMNSILKRWHQAGLHTAAQVEAGDRPARREEARPKVQTAAPQEDYQPSLERIQESEDWLDEYMKNREKEG